MEGAESQNRPLDRAQQLAQQTWWHRIKTVYVSGYVGWCSETWKGAASEGSRRVWVLASRRVGRLASETPLRGSIRETLEAAVLDLHT